MKAQIKNITKNSNDFQYPQMDIEVEFIDKYFPADQHYPDGGKRLFIFTLPPEQYAELTQAELEKMIIEQGKEFRKILEAGTNLESKKTEFNSLVGLEVNI